jgi:hypothetical protein
MTKTQQQIVTVEQPKKTLHPPYSYRWGLGGKSSYFDALLRVGNFFMLWGRKKEGKGGRKKGKEEKKEEERRKKRGRTEVKYYSRY